MMLVFRVIVLVVYYLFDALTCQEVLSFFYSIEQKSLVVGQRGDTVIKANSREYYCQECDKTYNLSSVEILRHKQTHKRIT